MLDKAWLQVRNWPLCAIFYTKYQQAECEVKGSALYVWQRPIHLHWATVSEYGQEGNSNNIKTNELIEEIWKLNIDAIRHYNYCIVYKNVQLWMGLYLELLKNRQRLYDIEYDRKTCQNMNKLKVMDISGKIQMLKNVVNGHGPCEGALLSMIENIVNQDQVYSKPQWFQAKS